MTQTHADRSEAAKKAAATRQRNESRDASSRAGKRAAASRHRRAAADHLTEARRSTGHAVSDVTSAYRSLGKAAIATGRSVADLAGGVAGKR